MAGTRSQSAKLTLTVPLTVRGQPALVMQRLRQAWRGVPVFSLMMLTVAILCALFAPLLAPYDPIRTNPVKALETPSLSQHLLGTDHLGRDVLSRLIYGARISITVGFLAVFVAGALGVLIAVVSGVYQGWVDRVLMRVTDAFLALPYLMVAVTVISLLKPSLMNVILVIGLLRWMDYARVLRGEVLRLIETDFVRLAVVAGCTQRQIITRHIFPNMVNTLLVLTTLGVGSGVIAEAALSFLGLGVPRPRL
jgi:peptide/nickel transport system permease protein